MTHNQISARYRKLLAIVLENIFSTHAIDTKWDAVIYDLANTYSKGMPHITTRAMDAAILGDIADHLEEVEGIL